MKMEALLSAVHIIKNFCEARQGCTDDCPFFNGTCMFSEIKHMDLKKVNDNIMESAVYGYVYEDIDTVTPYKDCFAYCKKENGDEECDALNGMYCLLEPYRYCPFFKDKDERKGVDRKNE